MHSNHNQAVPGCGRTRCGRWDARRNAWWWNAWRFSWCWRYNALEWVIWSHHRGGWLRTWTANQLICSFFFLVKTMGLARVLILFRFSLLSSSKCVPPRVTILFSAIFFLPEIFRHSHGAHNKSCVCCTVWTGCCQCCSFVMLPFEMVIFPWGDSHMKRSGMLVAAKHQTAPFGVDTVLLGGSGASEGRFWGKMKPVPESEMSPGHFSLGGEMSPGHFSPG